MDVMAIVTVVSTVIAILSAIASVLAARTSRQRLKLAEKEFSHQLEKDTRQSLESAKRRIDNRLGF